MQIRSHFSRLNIMHEINLFLRTDGRTDLPRSQRMKAINCGRSLKQLLAFNGAGELQRSDRDSELSSHGSDTAIKIDYIHSWMPTLPTNPRIMCSIIGSLNSEVVQNLTPSFPSQKGDQIARERRAVYVPVNLRFLQLDDAVKSWLAPVWVQR